MKDILELECGKRTSKSRYEASSSNLTVCLTAPKGKGRRLIITHIGSKEGLVRDAADIFTGKKSGDYIPRKKGCGEKKKIPISSWKKSAIQEWLTERKESDRESRFN
ncbi:hypothetical protein TNCV_4455861 [Trichonephila clavipes]|nr:hypothetical protein TNCV_4455861 [Trichonephila clavipes]